MPRHKTCKTSEIAAGCGKKFEIAGNRIAVFNVNGSFFAIDDICRHKRGTLARGILGGYTVSCPQHGWKFDVTTGRCATNPEGHNRSYPVTVENGEVFVEI
jgi:NAD(P)H-dependent nitrite reductase small subunit